MNPQTRSAMRQWIPLTFILILLLVVGSTGCTQSSPPPPTTTMEPIQPPTPTLEPVPTLSPPKSPVIEPTDEVTMEAGKTIAIQASAEGANRYEWRLQGDGAISESTEPAILYTAPEEGGGIAILTVTAYNDQGASSPTSLVINVTAGKTLIDLQIETPEAKTTITASTKITCEGSYSLPPGIDSTNVHVWIVLRDDYGNYYPQNPPVTFADEEHWEATNVRPGPGITQILAVQVTRDGHQTFREKVVNRVWEAFTELPEGSEILDTVNIATQ